jgi:hypothetical protein
VSGRSTLLATAGGVVALLAIVAAGGGLAGVVRSDAQPRPFRHAAHEAVACAECHGTGAQHRAVRAWTAADCAACHHDPARPLSCVQCHDPDDVARPRAMLMRMTLSLRADPVARPTTFDHVRHAAYACAECHRPESGVFLTPTACATCHTEHHEGRAQCGACHASAEPETHGLVAHLTCAGSGCHAVAADRQPVLSRELCLFCHVEQRDHHPGGVCYECHVLPGLDP